LGQHFLVAPWVYDRLLDSSGVGPEDAVLEIGPGLGTLTRLLSGRVRRVVAVELDRKLMPVLHEQLRGCGNVDIVQGDILDHAPAQLMGLSAATLGETDGYHVVANLPYYITARVLAHLLRERPRPLGMTLMVQRDVAERIVAAPGDLSLLAISVQVFGEPELAFEVPPEAFLPPPKIWSAVLHVRGRREPLVAEPDLARFFAVASAGFGQKRKQLHNSLAAGLRLSAASVAMALERAGIDPQRRAQTLAIPEWLRLMDALPSVGPTDTAA
jgi:16S rRNA (adenine1518-N6/adenine1519-N6)-dimethyltransferase